MSRNNPQLVFLMETKICKKMEAKVKESINFDCYIEISSNGNSGGLMLLWRREIDVTVMSYSSGHIDVFLKEDDWRWRFIGIYGQPNP